MTKAYAVEEFKTYHLPAIKDASPTTRRTAWNDFVDYLQKDGRVTESQAERWVQPSFCK
jgi:hypothetical protein